MGSKARIPRSSEKFSNKPPTTAPSTFAPSAAPGEVVHWNSRENNNPANITGTEKTTATSAPTNAGGPGIRVNGISYARISPNNNGRTIQTLDTILGK